MALYTTLFISGYDQFSVSPWYIDGSVQNFRNSSLVALCHWMPMTIGATGTSSQPQSGKFWGVLHRCPVWSAVRVVILALYVRSLTFEIYYEKMTEIITFLCVHCHRCFHMQNMSNKNFGHICRRDKYKVEINNIIHFPRGNTIMWPTAFH